MSRIVKSNGEEKLALSKKDFCLKKGNISIKKLLGEDARPDTRTASASFSVEYQDVINKCIDVFYRHHGIRINRTQALDHILHSWVAIE